MNEHDDELRALFQDATSDVRPQGSLDDILDRTKKVDPMTRRWFLPVVAAAAVIGLAIGGAAWLSRDDSPSPSPGPLGTTGPTPTTSTTPEAPTTRQSTVYYVGTTTAGPRLFGEPVVLHSADGNISGFTLDAATRAVSGSPSDPDYRTDWPHGIEVRGASGCDEPCELQITFSNTDVEARPKGMSEAEAELCVEQLVRTVLAAMDSHDTVFFAADDDTTGTTNRLDRVLGVDVTGSLRPAGDDTVLAPVQLTNLADGQQVRAGDLTVSGVAATFEANVVWEVRDADGRVVQHGHTTATECCTLAPYEFTVKNLEPGRYTVLVHEEDMSGEGRPVNQDTKEIVVQ